MSPTMDPLPDLQYNYNRLETNESQPLGAVPRLLMGSEEWNHVASEGRRIGIPKPAYFVLISQNPEDAPIVILAYNISSHTWIEKFIEVVNYFHLPGDLYMPFDVEETAFCGLACQPPEFHIETRFQTTSSILVIHARMVTYFPAVPRLHGSALGMAVDTSTRPYTFKLIKGNCYADTLILDSRTNTWETKPSRMVRRKELRICPSPKLCVQCDKHMYVWSDCDEIQVYSLEEDQWSTLNPPPLHASSALPPRESDWLWLEHWHIQNYPVADFVGDRWIVKQPPHALQDQNYPMCTIVGSRSTVIPPRQTPHNQIPLPSHARDFRGLGHWQSEIYAVSQNANGTLSVWKLVDRPTHEWSEYARIPPGFFTYLLDPGTRLPIVITHYEECFLMHVLENSDANVMMRRRRYVLFCIATKSWEILQPMRV